MRSRIAQSCSAFCLSASSTSLRGGRFQCGIGPGVGQKFRRCCVTVIGGHVVPFCCARFAASMTSSGARCAYRRIMFSERCPNTVATIRLSTPARSISVAALWRRSWNLKPESAARFLATSQACRQLRGLRGSAGDGNTRFAAEPAPFGAHLERIDHTGQRHHPRLAGLAGWQKSALALEVDHLPAQVHDLRLPCTAGQRDPDDEAEIRIARAIARGQEPLPLVL